MIGKTLKEMVGGNLRVVLSEDGFTVTNGAGTAHYDKGGYRTAVSGIPEYFPVTISVYGLDILPKKQAYESGYINVKGQVFINNVAVQSKKTTMVYLSFNHLYLDKGDDMHGATLSYQIMHGDKLLVAGELQGKSLAKYVRPIIVEECEITQPLTVYYVCTGTVEGVSVSL